MLNGWIYIDDFTELWLKLKQRGLSFLFNKLSFNEKDRTISSFRSNFIHSNWWIIPEIGKRINEKITGDPEVSYETYTSKKYLSESSTMISIGCGMGSHELKFAESNKSLFIKAYDFSPDLIASANNKAIEYKINNIAFICQDVYSLHLVENSVDCFLFNASLHHFKEIDVFLNTTIMPALKDGGIIILFEYVGPNRMSFSKYQIDYCNQVLLSIPKKYRRILNSKSTKSRVYRLGKLRMLISDPSECVDSESIRPSLYKYCEVLEEKAVGGNILMPVFKHIAHNFINDGKDVLQTVFDKEDKFLDKNLPDMIFGVYKKNT